MYELPAQIPDVDVLLDLAPEELAAKMLFILKKRLQARGEVRFHPGNMAGELGPRMHGGGPASYPESRVAEASLAVREAWAWLEGQGLVIPDEGMNGSSGFKVLSRRARNFASPEQMADYAAARTLPRGMLHPTIADKVWMTFMRGEYSSAVLIATRAVEIAVREAGGFSAGDLGVSLMRLAFGKSGPLTDPSALPGEQEALAALFAGAIGSFKNPHSHRDINLDDPREAAETIMLASLLLRIVDRRAGAER